MNMHTVSSPYLCVNHARLLADERHCGECPARPSTLIRSGMGTMHAKDYSFQNSYFAYTESLVFVVVDRVLQVLGGLVSVCVRETNAVLCKGILCLCAHTYTCSGAPITTYRYMGLELCACTVVSLYICLCSLYSLTLTLIDQPTNQPINRSINLCKSVYSSIYLSVCLSIFLALVSIPLYQIYLHLSITITRSFPDICLPACLPVCLSVRYALSDKVRMKVWSGFGWRIGMQLCAVLLGIA